MQDLKIHADYDQIARALAQAKPESKWYSLENLLRIAQLVSIIGIGIAGLLVYFSFDRRAQKIQLTLDELSVEEKNIQIQKLKQRQPSFDHNIQVRHLGPYQDTGKEQFHITYSWNFSNLGDVEHEITYFTVEVYTAHVQPSMDSPVIEINNVDQDGPIKWEFQFSRAFYYKPKWTPDKSFKLKTGILISDKGGGGTASLNAGESSSDGIEMFILGQRSDWINVVGHAGIDGAGSPDKRWDYGYTKCLYEDAGDAQKINSDNKR